MSYLVDFGFGVKHPIVRKWGCYYINQLLQINVANLSIIEFYRRAKKLFVPLFFVVLSFFSSSLINICSLTNNLPSNVRKVPPNNLEGQKMALHWQISAFSWNDNRATHNIFQINVDILRFMLWKMQFVQVLTTAHIYFLSQIC